MYLAVVTLPLEPVIASQAGMKADWGVKCHLLHSLGFQSWEKLVNPEAIQEYVEPTMPEISLFGCSFAFSSVFQLREIKPR